MTREEAIEGVQEFITYLKDMIEHEGYNDPRFDKQQAERDIEALTMARNSLEVDEKYEILYESSQDFPKFTPCDFCEWETSKDAACESCYAEAKKEKV